MTTKNEYATNFFLGNLAVSQKMIYNVHENNSAEKGIPKPDQRGNYLNSKPKVTAQPKERVLEHIKSFL